MKFGIVAKTALRLAAQWGPKILPPPANIIAEGALKIANVEGMLSESGGAANVPGPVSRASQRGVEPFEEGDGEEDYE